MTLKFSCDNIISRINPEQIWMKSRFGGFLLLRMKIIVPIWHFLLNIDMNLKDIRISKELFNRLKNIKISSILGYFQKIFKNMMHPIETNDGCILSFLT